MAQRILLHACCGPCAIAPVQSLREAGFEVTALFVNPNIHPLSEYLRRREAMEECAQRLALPVIWRDDLWNLARWLGDVAGAAKAHAVGDSPAPTVGDSPAPRAHDLPTPRDEDQARCTYCYETRLSVTAHTAAAEGFDCFSSSLLYSRHQRHELIAALATAHAKACGTVFYYADFREGWQKGIDISKAWGVYRQPYCGCVYSEAERYAKKLAKLLPTI